MNLESDQFDANRGNGHTDAASTGAAHSSRVADRSESGTGRRIVVGAITLLIVLAIAFGIGVWLRHRHANELASTDEQMADTPPAVAVAAVHRAVQRKILTLPAEARAMNETTLYARTNGYINKWLVDIGDKVKRGQTLAIIDTPELDEQLNAAQAKVSQSKSEASLSVQSAKFAKVTFDRWQAAQPEGVVSEQERDEKSAELDTANAKVAAANAQVAVDEAEVHRLETMVSFKNVTAPFDGTITQRHIDIGDLVTSGSSSNTTSLLLDCRLRSTACFCGCAASCRFPEDHGRHESKRRSQGISEPHFHRHRGSDVRGAEPIFAHDGSGSDRAEFG